MNDTPIHSRPLSQAGRDNYDRIFRKGSKPRLILIADELEMPGPEAIEAMQKIHYTGRTPCDKCGTTHWMHGSCPPPKNQTP